MSASTRVAGVRRTGFIGHNQMFFKTITIQLKPGCKRDFVACQQLWIEAMQRAAGYAGSSLLDSADRSHEMLLIIAWSDEQAYRDWMNDEHDAIAGRICADRFYERIESKHFRSTDLGRSIHFH